MKKIFEFLIFNILNRTFIGKPIEFDEERSVEELKELVSCYFMYFISINLKEKSKY
jgi:hypothetical protein